MGKIASILNDTAAGPQVVRIRIVINPKRFSKYHFNFYMCWLVHIVTICKLCKPPPCRTRRRVLISNGYHINISVALQVQTSIQRNMTQTDENNISI